MHCTSNVCLTLFVYIYAIYFYRTVGYSYDFSLANHLFSRKHDVVQLQFRAEFSTQ